MLTFVLSSRLLTSIALSKSFLKSTYQNMKKRTKTNIVDDLIEKTATSPPTAGFPYSSLPFGKVLHSPSFCVRFDVATAKNSGLTLMFKTKPISLTPGGRPQVPPEQHHGLHTPEGEEASNYKYGCQDEKQGD